MKDEEFLENTEEDGDFEEEEGKELVEPTTTKTRRTETPVSPVPSRDDGPSDVCQYCGKPQSHYDYKKEWRGWVKCPDCGYYIKCPRCGDGICPQCGAELDE